MPSKPRVVISCQVCCERAPTSEPSESMDSPTSIVVRRPMRSERMEPLGPKTIAPTWTIPSKVPDWTRLIPRSWRMKVNAPGSFHTCIAATTPHATIAIQVRSLPGTGETASVR